MLEFNWVYFQQWDFSLRRANLHLVDFANQNGGFIIVDSTRRGKVSLIPSLIQTSLIWPNQRMPDALSKTVPIWCAVINRAVAKRRSKESTSAVSAEDTWNTNLYCPPNVVSPTEKSQIEAHIDKWADQLLVSLSPRLVDVQSLTVTSLHKGIEPDPPGSRRSSSTVLHPSRDITSAIPSHKEE